VREEIADLARDLRRYLEGLEGHGALEPAPGAAVRAGARRPERGLEELRSRMLRCTGCSLHRTRRTVVFGEGNDAADIMFVGEAPGQDEDLQGKPFVGRAGQLLTKILESIALRREEVFIGNVLKCRPPGNRDPSPGEIQACLPFLEAQIDLIRPKIICTLGRFAAQTLLGVESSLSVLRGRVHERALGGGVRVIATYHPAACLRYPQYKRPVWEDMQRLRDEYRALGGRI
jgi:uracil-DNA glycosylase family 4